MTLKFLQGDWEAAGQFVGAAAATAAAPAFSFHNKRNSGMFLGPGLDTSIVSDTGIVDIQGNVGGTAPGIIELYISATALSGKDCAIQFNGGQTGGRQNYRLVNVGVSGSVGEGCLVIRSPDQIDRLVFGGPITTGYSPLGQGTVIVNATSSTTPFIIRKSTGTPGTNETHIYQGALSLNITPKETTAKIFLNAGITITPQDHTNGSVDFTNTKFTETGFRCYTNDAAPYSGTGLIQMKAAGGSGFTELEADNDAGFKLHVHSHDQVTDYGSLIANATNWTFSKAVAMTTSMVVGGGTAITKMRVFSTLLTSASVAANTTAEQTFAVAGLTTADKVFVNKPAAQAGLGIVGQRVSAADTLAITYANVTGGSITPTAETYQIVAIRS
jgi:hypothetical protein